MIVKVNGNNVSLRTLLESEGFVFPCGGKGLCGRCRVVAPFVEPTDRDRAFINKEDLERGVRLACDKTVNGELTLECALEKREVKPRKLDKSDAYVVFAEDATYIGLCDEGEIIDGLVLPPVPVDYRALRGTAQKETVELYEKHGLAKAMTVLVTGTPQKVTEMTSIIETFNRGYTVDAVLMNMPAEDVYLPPKPSALIGGDFVLELLGRPVGTLVTKGYYFGYIAENSVYCARVALDPLNPAPYLATAEYFMEKFRPEHVVTIGEPTGVIKEAVQETSACDINSARALYENRVKTALDKIARKIENIDLVNDDLWQEILTDIAE